MLCKKPYMIGMNACPCMRCMPCRLNRRRTWMARILLEQKSHDESCFVTLTYNDDHLPADGSLEREHYQSFVKRLRKHFSPTKIRYFLVGEYGDTTERPHYHAAIFGISAEALAGTEWMKKRGTVLAVGEPLRSLWGNGEVAVGALERKSAQYVAKYCVKKMTVKDDVRLRGREPEFARMSLRPGLGAWAVRDIGEGYMATSGALDQVARDEDVPSSFKLGGKSLPLGRYLRRRLRYELGFGSADAPDKAKAKSALEMRVLFEESQKDSENKSKSVTQIIVDSNAQKIINLEAREKIWASKETL